MSSSAPTGRSSGCVGIFTTNELAKLQDALDAVSMATPLPIVFEHAQPLSSDSLEPAVSRVTVILSTSGPFTISGQPKVAFLSGPRTTPLPVIYPPNASCLEWSFSVFETRALLGINPKDISESVFDLSALPKTETLRRILDGQTISAATSLNTDDVSRDMQLLKAAWPALSAGRSRSLAAVSSDLGVTLRRLELAFQSAIGFTPKQLQSLLRFEQVSQLLGTDETLSSIAHKLGFSDQSHMTRHVSRYSGLTPSALRRALTISA